MHAAGCKALGAQTPPEIVFILVSPLFCQQTGGFLQSQHQIHILHGGARSALAQIVQPRGDHGLLLITADKNLQAIGAGQGAGVQKAAV